MEKVKQRTIVKSLIQFINEARKFPHLNPKVSVNQEILDHMRNAKTFPGSGIKNSFVSFTSVDKLGINPRSRYDTPLGIYAYPSEYIQTKIGSRGEMRELPFAGKSPYANIFSVRGNIVIISSMSNSDANKYYDKIVNVYLKALGASRGTERWKQNMPIIGQIIDDASSRAKFAQRAGGRFWYVTIKVTEALMKISREWGRSSYAVAWNRLFREIGIDGCVDWGIGIIHTNEPIQAVFFSKKAIKQNKLVYNKYSPEYLDRKKKSGELMKTIIWDGGTWTDEEWKGGTWKKGTWEGEVWMDGRWKDGTWKDGLWVDGIWEKGTWEGGTWEEGTWKEGFWEDGIWKDGTWENGIWLAGVWIDGTWKGGFWEEGIWENGTWERGTWMGGTWLNGIWKGGTWEDGIWEDGTWLGGYDEEGNYHPEGDSPDKW